MFVQGSHAFAMFPPTRYLRGGATRAHNVTTFTNVLTKLKFRLPACIVWFYYASSSIIWWFLDKFFFLLSVLVSLKEKEKERLTNGYFFEHPVLAYTIELMNGLGLVRWTICCRF